MKNPVLSAARLAFFYLMVGLAWILFSDRLVVYWVSDPSWVTWIQSVKGGAFVLVTGAVFFYLAQRALAEHRRLAQRDTLTGLFNRGMLRDEIDCQISLAAGEHQSVAVFCLNLDDFKLINSTLGTAVGDQALRQCALALRQHFGARAVLGRIGADEFAVAVMGEFDQAALDNLATELLQLPRSMEVPGERIALTGTIGVALYPQDGLTARELVAAANTAIEQARTKGIGAFSMFNRAFGQTVGERIQLLSDLKQA
ncbi:MAG: GGDEF domain-containing protein, partial [Natronospirillum sp.]